jgi:tRNA threonylcarbamoyladenosine biosynthesis protein TsaB
MMCLAFEFSTDRRSVAVADGESLRSEVIHQTTRETPVVTLIESALTQAGVQREDIERLVVGLGPGSYTGVRVAISLVQGWQLGRGTPVVGWSSLEALAEAAKDLPGEWLLAIDAQRGDFASARAERGQLLEPVRLRSLEEIRAWHASGHQVTGPEIARFLPGAGELFPSASSLARLGARGTPIPAELLTPIYLREASFVKAPPARTDLGF